MTTRRLSRRSIARMFLAAGAVSVLGVFAPTPAMASCEHNDLVVEYQCPWYPPFDGQSTCVGVGHHGVTTSTCLPPSAW